MGEFNFILKTEKTNDGVLMQNDSNCVQIPLDLINLKRHCNNNTYDLIGSE